MGACQAYKIGSVRVKVASGGEGCNQQPLLSAMSIARRPAPPPPRDMVKMCLQSKPFMCDSLHTRRCNPVQSIQLKFLLTSDFVETTGQISACDVPISRLRSGSLWGWVPTWSSRIRPFGGLTLQRVLQFTATCCSRSSGCHVKGCVLHPVQAVVLQQPRLQHLESSGH